ETPLTFPNGCHVAEVEIDPATGALALVSYAAVDDCGNALNRMIVEGQAHGSIAQGIGQAVMEQAGFDGSGGQPIPGSFIGQCDSPCRRPAVLQGCAASRAGEDQPAWGKGGGRSRYDCGHCRSDECDCRCNPGRRRRAPRHAGDRGEDLARVPDRTTKLSP